MINKQKINKIIFKADDLKDEIAKLNKKELKYLKLLMEIRLNLDELTKLQK